MDAVIYPSPDDLGRAPLWENYVIAQAVQASLGLIPQDALAVGVRVSGTDVELVFQLSRASEEGETDMQDILEELTLLVGDDVLVRRVSTVTAERVVSPMDGVCWFYLARR